MVRNYLIRLDDACPTMDKANWQKAFDIFDRYGVKPMIGIIPNNCDPMQQLDEPDPDFWNKVSGWIEKGWTIALHGYNHCYLSKCAGINPFWRKSEFAGLPLEQQREKIRKGMSILHEHGINTNYFFAPSHTMDMNTLEALKQESDIRIVSDGIALKPYKIGEFTFIPQIGGRDRDMPIGGLYTFCYHPSVMKDISFYKMEAFIKSHREQIVSFDNIDLSSAKEKNICEDIMHTLFFFQRRLRGLY